MKFKEAVRSGDLSVLQRICADMHPRTRETCLSANREWCFRKAVSCGYVDILDYLIKIGCIDVRKQLWNSKCREICMAVANKSGESIFHYLTTKVDKIIMAAAIEYDYHKIYDIAARNGRLDVFQYYEKLDPIGQCGWYRLEDACIGRSLPVFKFLIEKSCIEVGNMSGIYSAVTIAIRFGCLHIIKYLGESLVDMAKYVRQTRKDVCDAILYSRDVQVLDYFMGYPLGLDLDIEGFVREREPFGLYGIVRAGKEFFKYCMDHFDKSRYDLPDRFEKHKYGAWIVDSIQTLEVFRYAQEEFGINIPGFSLPDQISPYILRSIDIDLFQWMMKREIHKKEPLQALIAINALHRADIVNYVCSVSGVSGLANIELLKPYLIRHLNEKFGNTIYTVMRLENRYASAGYISVFSGLPCVQKTALLLRKELRIEAALKAHHRVLKRRILRFLADQTGRLVGALVQHEIYAYIHFPIMFSSQAVFAKRLSKAI